MGVWYVHCTEFPPVWHKKKFRNRKIFQYIERFHSRGQHLRKFFETKKKRLQKKTSSHTGLAWNMAAVSLFWETNMAAVTSRENTPGAPNGNFPKNIC